MELDINSYLTDTVMSVPFCKPDISDAEIAEVTEVLKSGWITTGPKVKKLEGLLADFLDAERCACLSSQTACGELSLRMLQIGASAGGSALDEVITSAYTYTASASVIRHVGAKIVLVDTQKDSLEMDYDALEAAINEHTKAIIPVDVGGVPCDYDRIMDIVERKRALFSPNGTLQEIIGRPAVIEDAAHALGARRVFRGEERMIGSISDFTTFSFHAVKNYTTAEGGAVTWNIPGADNDEIYRQFQLFSLHGQSRDAFKKNTMGGWEYDVLGPWYKFNMTDIMAAIGLAQLERYPQMLERRRELIERYDAAFLPEGAASIAHYTDRFTSSGHLYMSRIPGADAQDRNMIIHRMAARGIVCNVHFKPLPLLTAYKNMGFHIEDYPNAYGMFENEITLPLYTKLTDREVDYVIRTYKSILKDYIK